MISRKKTRLLGGIFVLTSSLGFAASAQSEAGNREQNPRKNTATVRGVRRRVTLDERVKALTTALDLTEPQQAALRRILEQRQAETLRLRHDTSIPGSVRIEWFRALQDQTVLRIRGILNDEQRNKYDPLAVRKIESSPQDRSVDDWLKAAAPPSTK